MGCLVKLLRLNDSKLTLTSNKYLRITVLTKRVTEFAARTILTLAKVQKKKKSCGILTFHVMISGHWLSIVCVCVFPLFLLTMQLRKYVRIRARLLGCL